MNASFGGLVAVSYTHLDVYKRQVQKFADPPPGINQDQDGINPRFFLMFPNRGDFIPTEGKAAGGQDWIRSQQVRITMGDNVQFQGEPVKMAPQVFNGRLSTVPPPAIVNGFLHLVGANLFVDLIP